MMERGRQGLRLAALSMAAALSLSACSVPFVGGPRQARIPEVGGAAKVGKPYKVAGVWYRPRSQPAYDRRGIASWYGRKFHGRRTANGERYNMNALSAAHTTLPLPSLVRVSNLDNGRSVVLRVNDRGPFVRGRIIDVSRYAARLLGFQKQGTARVRVQAVGPDGRYPALDARNGKAARQLAANRAEQAARRQAALTGKVEYRVARKTRLFVQVGAFADKRNARRAAAAIAGIGPTRVSPVAVDGQRLHRVRIGPIRNVATADEILEHVIARGKWDAHIVVE